MESVCSASTAYCLFRTRPAGQVVPGPLRFLLPPAHISPAPQVRTGCFGPYPCAPSQATASRQQRHSDHLQKEDNTDVEQSLKKKS